MRRQNLLVLCATYTMTLLVGYGLYTTSLLGRYGYVERELQMLLMRAPPVRS